MSAQPPRKKLKQATIFESFMKQKSISKEPDTVTLKKETENSSPAIDLTDDPQGHHDMNTGKEEVEERERKEKSDKAAEAADKRLRQSCCAPLDDAAENERRTDALTRSKEEENDGHSDGSSEEKAGTSDTIIRDVMPSPGQPPSVSGHSESQTSQWDSSRELFSDSEQQQPKTSSSSPCIKGPPLRDMNSQPACSMVLPELQPSPVHTVLIHCGNDGPKAGTTPRPFPNRFRDKWDKDYVRMPCSAESLYPMNHKTVKRWELIENALSQPIMNSHQLEEAILKYNSRQSDSWNFESLHSFFFEVFSDKENDQFFKEVLPKMAELALDLPKICTAPIPLLHQGQPHKLTMSQKQVACLLANAFFCTFPRRNTRKRNAEFSSYPDINFNAVFMPAYDRHDQKMEKIKCIIHYFKQVTTEMPTGVLTFKRQLVHDPPHWESSQATLTRLHVTSRGTIEDDGQGMLQVDFANKYIGGGVLGRGCVQEEIRFIVCPELIVSRLFTEVLEDNECLIMTGAQRFSDYNGYAQSFKWAGSYTDPTPSDEWCRRLTEIVAIDAMMFRADENQFGPFYVRRELEKAYSGFCYIPEAGRKIKDDDTKRAHTPAVATGNWGCGAFGGDVKLKALLQLMAAAEAGRDVCYFTFNDARLVSDLHDMHAFIVENRSTVGELMGLIEQYYKKYKRSYTPPDLYSFIYRAKDTTNGSADDEARCGDNDEDSREGHSPIWVDDSQEIYKSTP